MLAQLHAMVRWHPKYATFVLPDHQILLLSEEDPYILSGENYCELHDELKLGLDYVKLFLQSSDVRKQALQLNLLNNLVDKGLLEKISSEGAPYVVPDFKAAPVIVEYSSNLELVILSQIDCLNLVSMWAEKLEMTDPISVVVVDDYLDPRLDKIQKIQNSRGRRWLLIKPAGVKPLLGPLFDNGDRAVACLQCLKKSLNQSQTVRKWVIEQFGLPFVSIPVYRKLRNMRRFFDAIVPNAQNFIEKNITNTLLSLELEELKTHSLHKMPNCVHCGDNRLFSQTSTRPVEINSSLKNCVDDCGVRVIHPEASLQRLEKYVSDITGVITQFEPLEFDASGEIKIYKSTFSKLPNVSKPISVDDFIQISLGKGLSSIQSKVSALGEAIERFAAQYQGDEPWRCCAPNDLTKRYFLPEELEQYSTSQLSENSKSPASIKRLEIYLNSHAMHWASCWSLTYNEYCYVPFTYCYANTPFDDQKYIRWNSNGCAAGNTREEAVLQGFYELIERDAVAIWWYNRLVVKKVDLSRLPQQHQELISRKLAHEYDYWVLDITHDFKVPVMAAVAQHKVTRALSLGFGCHDNAVLACERALVELCQILPIRNKGIKEIFDFDAVELEPYLFPADEPAIDLQFYQENSNTRDMKDDIERCVTKGKKQGLEALVLDYTRANLPLHTVKVIVPGMCHIWPQLGNQRLYSVPVKLGWRSTPVSEQELNPIPLFI